MRRAATILLALAGPLVGLVAPGAEPDVDLTRLEVIQLSEDAGPRELAAGQELQKRLEELHGLKPALVQGKPDRSRPGIFLGRAAALASGRITADELEAVRHDGYVLKAGGSAIAVAGYRPLGTVYGVYALLERLGWKLYPLGQELPPLAVAAPRPDKKLAALAIRDKPFFEWRSLMDHIDRGMFGASYGDLGDPQAGANPEFLGRKAQKTWAKDEWLGSDHTAPYLVPKQLYYDRHPEYFAMAGGKRLPKDTVMQRMSLCQSNPEVHKIAAARMVEWMDLQNDRRFFYSTDADAEPCRCPECTASDPLPYYNTDRYLAWVNSVARAVRARHPDKVLLALAYGATVKPPLRERLEPNVIVLYCPWYWNSANNRFASWAHPGNLTAMEEYLSWVMRFPSQVGVYDYPGHDAYLWLRGHEERVKWEARMGGRAVYCCGCARFCNGLFHYVVSRLNWDPLLDSARLEDEWAGAVFGPAAECLREYLRLDEAARRRDLFSVLSDEALCLRARAVLQEADRLVKDRPALEQMRVQKEILAWLESYLPATNPRSPQGPVTRAALDRFRDDVLWYLDLDRRYLAHCASAGKEYRWAAVSRESARKQALAGLGLEAENIAADPARITTGVATAAAALEPAPKSVAIVRVASASDVQGWTAECTTPELAAAPDAATVVTADGRTQAAVRVRLPLSKLPEYHLPNHCHGPRALRAGTVVLARPLPGGIDISGCHFVELHLAASTDVPVTVYLDMEQAGGVRSDGYLHAGEQILRIDLRQHAAGTWGRMKEKWTGKVTGLKIDFWPQDNFYPFSRARDAEVSLMGVTACNRDRSPADLPYAGRVVWLTQYRPNVPHTIVVDKGRLRQWRNKVPEYSAYYPERFRTRTEQRVLTPIGFIAADTARGSSPEAAEALQGYLHRLFGARLPIRDGRSVGPDTGNGFLLGRQAALASARITPQEIEFAGPEGYVLRAHQGRIVIAGRSDQATAFGAARYLEDHGVRLLEPGKRELVPDLKQAFLHELYLVDRPFFAERDVPGGWRLGCQEAAAVPTGAAAKSRAEPARSVDELAAIIKDAARRRQPLPATLSTDAAASPLHAYVAAKLLWDPFRDASRLIAEFKGAEP